MADAGARAAALMLAGIISCASPSREATGPPMTDYPIFSEERRELTREYARRHYGIDEWRLASPAMVVVHYTAIGSIEESLRYFEPAVVSPGRAYIRQFGRLNVGVHFVVDRDGSVYRLLPEHVMGRHAIGFNHVAFGIENVGRSAKDLTQAQARSNALLVSYLVKKYPGVRFLVGHHEYMRRDCPHFAHYRALDRTYRPTVKIDPGDKFMGEVRHILENQHGIVLEK
ncbi:MAG TPA: N-acetylmuramoyl-L-alanine amidase [Spirochaetes bacterium]|nr:N-acetylmuramoyl-L-alanine amidase [Spirochaetota bacterium]